MARLSFTDRMKLVNSGLFVVLGAFIIYRYATVATHWLILALGIAFAAFGVYRLLQFKRALSGGGK